MDESEPWTRASLRVLSESMTVQELGELFGLASAGEGDDSWLIDLEENNSDAIDDVLRSATGFFRENIDTLRAIRGRCEIELRIGWAPTSGLAGVAFEKDLIWLLAEAGAELLLDVYGE